MNPRLRPRYRVGEIDGHTAADAASPEGVWVWQEGGNPDCTDHYEPKHKRVWLSNGTNNGRTIEHIMCAVHEAMHARQHAENCFVWRLRQAARFSGIPWGLAVGVALWRFAVGDWPRGVSLLLLALFIGILRGAAVLALETDAWTRTNRWISDNMITGAAEWKAMEEKSKASLWSYVKWIFGAR